MSYNLFHRWIRLKTRSGNKIINYLQNKKFSIRRVMVGPVIEIKHGKLRGTIRENIDGGNYYSFRGIPFAEPPVGELRFKVYIHLIIIN